MTETSEAEQLLPSATGHRRKVDLVLTTVTTLLFLGFLWRMIAHPGTMSAKAIILLGFALIVYSIVVTWLYQRWIDRAEQGGGRA